MAAGSALIHAVPCVSVYAGERYSIDLSAMLYLAGRVHVGRLVVGAIAIVASMIAVVRYMERT